MLHRFGRRTVRVAGTAVGVLAALPACALAVHWPGFGGDNGRSGYQPVQETRPPVRVVYARTAPGDRFLKTSILTSTGTPLSQRVVYGTVNPMEVMAKAPADANGRVHLRILAGGANVGPRGGARIDNGLADADVFGPGAAAPEPASVSFIDTSGPAGLGQVFAIHNDDDQSPTGDIALAQVDETSGLLVQDEPLAGTDGFSIASSPVATGPLTPEGDRVIFFVARRDDDERLFRVPIARAGTPSATVGTVTSTPDVNADPQASPTLVFLRDRAGTPNAHIAVGTGEPDNRLKTFRVTDLVPGPASDPLGGSVQTASVPVQPSGMTPNPAGPVTTAPLLYVAADVAGSTRVLRLIQEGNAQTLATDAASATLGGAPAPALATNQESERAAPTTGRVIVTTSTNLYVLRTADLGLAGTFSPTPLSSGTTGFSQPTAAASGKLIYVTNDEGEQFVLRVDDARRVAPTSFREHPGNAPPRLANSGMGQPSVSRGFVQFGSQKGLFVYHARTTAPPKTTVVRGTVISDLPGDTRTLRVEARRGRKPHRATGRVTFRHVVKATRAVSAFEGRVRCLDEAGGRVELSGHVIRGRTGGGENLAGLDFSFTIDAAGRPQTFSLPRFGERRTLLPCSGGRPEAVPVTEGVVSTGKAARP